MHSALHGELPPPPPRACFGRGELIEEIVEFATKLEPVALIGAGGIGKTNIALSVLHHTDIKERFGDNRRFIRCDQLSATCANFLARLSQVIGAGVENPEDLTLLRRYLTSKEMLIVLDNAESVLDPQGANAQEIYAVVDELSQFETICLCITSRITTVPRHCKRPAIPTLSMEAACDIFYRIYNNRGRSSIINNLLQRLDFHALSITLLATAASRNSWHYDRLAEEWETRRAQTLRADFNESLAATIELSLASPTFRDLSPGARDLLEVIAFFPQGIDENNLDWLFPTIIDAKDILDKFCVLSLTHRSNGFITMLAPIRDYLGPKDPKSSPLLCTTKVNYFSRLKANINPIEPGFREARWIVSEDLNVEHLLDIFTSIDPTSSEVWKACAHFMQHLYWHKPRKTILGPKIENLPDDQPSKPECLFGLGQLFESVGMLTEQKRLLSRVLRSARKREDDNLAARVLAWLSCANRQLGCCEEGIRQAKEASEAFESLGNTVEQADCLNDLGYTLFEDGQLDAAEEVILRAIQLLPEKGQEFVFGRSHRLLGNVYHSKAKKDKAVYHFEKALGIASPYNWRCELFWIHYSMADLFHDESKFDFAHAHVGQAKAYAVEDAYYMGHAMKMHARIWCRQGMFEDATSKALCAKEMYERLGAAEDLESCRSLLREIKLRKNWSPSGAPDPSGEHLSSHSALHLLTPHSIQRPRRQPKSQIVNLADRPIPECSQG